MKENVQLDTNEMKVILSFINSLSAVTLRHSTNDDFIRQQEEKVRQIRMDIMHYCEENSIYTFYGKSPTGFKLVKKSK